MWHSGIWLDSMILETQSNLNDRMNLLYVALMYYSYVSSSELLSAKTQKSLLIGKNTVLNSAVIDTYFTYLSYSEKARFSLNLGNKRQVQK